MTKGLCGRVTEVIKSRRTAPVVIVVACYVVATLVARRRGYNMGANVIVRCRKGHLFTTIWIPGASIKSLKLGWARLQRCPIGKHWSLVTPVKDSKLTDEGIAHRPRAP